MRLARSAPMGTQPGSVLSDSQIATWRSGPAHGVRRPSLGRSAIERLLRRIVRRGALTVVLPDGQTIMVGEHAAAPAVRVRIGDWRTVRQLALAPDPALGEAYMDGRLAVDRGT